MEDQSAIRDLGCGIPAAGVAAVRQTLVVRFRIGESLRFLSHAETLRLWQRACARAGIAVKYTAGFNPHPRLSLPLPRSVGVASEDELLVIRLSEEPVDADGTYEVRAQQSLQETLPAGIDIVRVELRRAGSFQARCVEYEFCLREDRAADLTEPLRHKGMSVLAGESWIVNRQRPGDPKARRIDVRPFLESIRVVGRCVAVKCIVMAAGSIRIEEIMQLLELKTEDLAGAIRRTAVEWIST
jgi:radical SAM-linked protein